MPVGCIRFVVGIRLAVDMDSQPPGSNSRPVEHTDFPGGSPCVVSLKSSIGQGLVSTNDETGTTTWANRTWNIPSSVSAPTLSSVSCRTRRGDTLFIPVNRSLLIAELSNYGPRQRNCCFGSKKAQTRNVSGEAYGAVFPLVVVGFGLKWLYEIVQGGWDWLRTHYYWTRFVSTQPSAHQTDRTGFS
jgi:hypothetical protein